MRERKENYICIFRRFCKTLGDRVDTCHLSISDRGPSDQGLVTQDRCFLINTKFNNAEKMNAVIREGERKGREFWMNEDTASIL
jgi:hypothetical protein